MKRAAVCLLAIGGLGAGVQAQQGAGVPVAEAERRASVERELQVYTLTEKTAEGERQATVAIRPRGVVETRVTKDAPYSGDAITEFVQALPDGNRIARKTVSRAFRDGEGRTRREQVVSGPTGDVTSVSITDPVAGVSFILEPDTRTAWRNHAFVAGSVGPAGRGGFGGLSPAKAPPDPAATTDERKRVEAAQMAAVLERGRGVMALKERDASGLPAAKPTREDLGERVIEGVSARGSRTTTIIPAGAVGNEQPITIVSEQWFCPELQVLVYTRHSDPRAGDTTYRLANIVRAEQDRSLFEVPADYTVKETGIKQPAPMFRQ